LKNIKDNDLKVLTTWLCGDRITNTKEIKECEIDLDKKNTHALETTKTRCIIHNGLAINLISTIDIV
jgi:hypothetical protein